MGIASIFEREFHSRLHVRIENACIFPIDRKFEIKWSMNCILLHRKKRPIKSWNHLVLAFNHYHVVSARTSVIAIKLHFFLSLFIFELSLSIYTNKKKIVLLFHFFYSAWNWTVSKSQRTCCISVWKSTFHISSWCCYLMLLVRIIAFIALNKYSFSLLKHLNCEIDYTRRNSLWLHGFASFNL